jgi:hypothetical protein
MLSPDASRIRKCDLSNISNRAVHEAKVLRSASVQLQSAGNLAEKFAYKGGNLCQSDVCGAEGTAVSQSRDAQDVCHLDCPWRTLIANRLNARAKISGQSTSTLPPQQV